MYACHLKPGRPSLSPEHRLPLLLHGDHHLVHCDIYIIPCSLYLLPELLRLLAFGSIAEIFDLRMSQRNLMELRSGENGE